MKYIDFKNRAMLSSNATLLINLLIVHKDKNHHTVSSFWFVRNCNVHVCVFVFYICFRPPKIFHQCVNV